VGLPERPCRPGGAESEVAPDRGCHERWAEGEMARRNWQRRRSRAPSINHLTRQEVGLKTKRRTWTSSELSESCTPHWSGPHD
jgi:uncharacterized protein (DUF2342 family)